MDSFIDLVAPIQDQVVEDALEPVAHLQVFSPNMADEGPEQLELVEVMVVLE